MREYHLKRSNRNSRLHSIVSRILRLSASDEQKTRCLDRSRRVGAHNLIGRDEPPQVAASHAQLLVSARLRVDTGAVAVSTQTPCWCSYPSCTSWFGSSWRALRDGARVALSLPGACCRSAKTRHSLRLRGEKGCTARRSSDRTVETRETNGARGRSASGCAGRGDAEVQGDKGSCEPDRDRGWRCAGAPAVWPRSAALAQSGLVGASSLRCSRTFVTRPRCSPSPRSSCRSG